MNNTQKLAMRLEEEANGNMSISKVFKNTITLKINNIPDTDLEGVALGYWLVKNGLKRIEVWNLIEDDKKFVGYFKEDNLTHSILNKAKEKVNATHEESVNHDLVGYLINKLIQNGHHIIHKAASPDYSTYYLSKDDKTYTVTASYKDDTITVKRGDITPFGNSSEVTKINIGNPDVDEQLVNVIDRLLDGG